MRSHSRRHATHILSLSTVRHSITAQTFASVSTAVAAHIQRSPTVYDSITADARGIVSTTNVTPIKDFTTVGNVIAPKTRGSIAVTDTAHIQDCTAATRIITIIGFPRIQGAIASHDVQIHSESILHRVTTEPGHTNDEETLDVSMLKAAKAGSDDAKAAYADVLAAIKAGPAKPEARTTHLA